MSLDLTDILEKVKATSFRDDESMVSGIIPFKENISKLGVSPVLIRFYNLSKTIMEGEGEH